MPGKLTATYLDASNEKSSVTVTGPTLVAGNIAAQTTLMNSLITAIAAIILGTHSKTAVVASEAQLSDVPPVNQFAQRENKWLVTYTGNTSNKKFQVEIPTPDLDKLVPGTDLADATDADVIAFVTAFEAFVLSPDNGTEAVTVLSIRFVGRNL